MKLTTETYASLIVQLDARFKELGFTVNDLATERVKGLLNGELMMLVTSYPFCALGWTPATPTPLDKLFLFTA